MFIVTFHFNEYWTFARFTQKKSGINVSKVTVAVSRVRCKCTVKRAFPIYRFYTLPTDPPSCGELTHSFRKEQKTIFNKLFFCRHCDYGLWIELNLESIVGIVFSIKHSAFEWIYPASILKISWFAVGTLTSRLIDLVHIHKS